MLLFDKIAEQKITLARDRGELDNLPGQGKPLVLDDDSAVPSDMRAAYRVMKNSGFMPPEIAHLKDVRQVESMLMQAETNEEKKRLLLKLSLLRSKLPALKLTTSAASRYQDKILQKLTR